MIKKRSFKGNCTTCYSDMFLAHYVFEMMDFKLLSASPKELVTYVHTYATYVYGTCHMGFLMGRHLKLFQLLLPLVRVGPAGPN